MASQDIFSTPAGSRSAKFFIVLLCASAMVLGCRGQAMPSGATSAPTAASMSLRSLITQTGEVTRQYVESIVGTNVVETALEVRKENIRQPITVIYIFQPTDNASHP